jgi:hypothetical protein
MMSDSSPGNISNIPDFLPYAHGHIWMKVDSGRNHRDPVTIFLIMSFQSCAFYKTKFWGVWAVRFPSMIETAVLSTTLKYCMNSQLSQGESLFNIWKVSFIIIKI